jgi:thioester reductase-like protein
MRQPFTEDTLPDFPLADLAERGVGYSQSKYVAENLVRQAASERGVPCTVFRPGMMSWCSSTGIANESDWVWRYFRGVLRADCTPVGERAFRLMPVEFAAAALVALGEAPHQGATDTYHLLHPTTLPVRLVLEEMERRLGRELPCVDLATWLARVEAEAERARQAGEQGIADEMTAVALYFAKGVPNSDREVSSSRKTLRALEEGHGKACPAFTSDSIAKFCERLAM